MKFKRTDLITRIEQAIERRTTAAAERTAESAAKAEQERADHVEATETAWLAFAATIRKRVRYGKPVTDDDIPVELRASSRGYVKTWNGRNNQPTAHRADTAQLAELLAILRACTDDEITTAALERIGAPTKALLRMGG